MSRDADKPFWLEEVEQELCALKRHIDEKDAAMDGLRAAVPAPLFAALRLEEAREVVGLRRQHELLREELGRILSHEDGI